MLAHVYNENTIFDCAIPRPAQMKALTKKEEKGAICNSESEIRFKPILLRPDYTTLSVRADFLFSGRQV